MTARVALADQIAAVRRAEATSAAGDVEALEAAARSLEWLSEHMPAVRATIAAAKAPGGEVPAGPKRRRGRPKKGESVYPEDFETFWKAYPTDPIMSKRETALAWQRMPEADRAAATAALPAFRAFCAKNVTYRPVHAVRFLTQRRFEGLAPVAAVASFSQVFVPIGTEGWRAWSATRAKPWPTTAHEGRQGWWFPSAMPEGGS